MEKRLRSSLQTSADSFLSTATTLPIKSAKPTIKSLIHSIKPSSDLSTSLPLSLHSSISSSLTSFSSNNPSTPKTPPSKKPRKSTRKLHPQDTHQRSYLYHIQIYAYIALTCVKHPKKAFLPEDLFPSVRELHDNLILFECESSVLGEISSLCEHWWKEGFVGRELLISQFLPFLVSRSLTLRKKVDVHRVCVLRDAFLLFDFEDESIEDLKLLLIRCVITPLYLKTEDGRRFISFLFGLTVQLLKEVLAMIKSQIPFGRKSMLEGYGEILFKGWKSVEGDFRKEIEDGLLQGLVEGAVFARDASFCAAIRRVIGGFTNQRTTDGVEKLLFRLAEPVIFRSLQVANSNVRQNALHLLLDLFPLEDPEATKEDKDALVEKQFFLLEKLLKDDCPDVRVVAVEGCCRVLHLFWEIIPSSNITKMLTIIFDDMSNDVSNEVRVSTLNGVIYLMGNPQAHEVLKILLPRLGNMISDRVLSIRIAVVDLLLLMMDIRGFQFNKVVNLDVLLNTLANDQSPVAQKITQLLIPSYFPSKVHVSEACSRVLTLMKRSPTAGARFCEFAAAEGASMKSLMELARFLTNVVLSPDGLDADHIKGIFIALGHLLRNLVNESSRREALKELFAGEKLKGLLTVATLGNAQSSLFEIVSVVSPAGVNALREECIRTVRNSRGLSVNSDRQDEVRSAHKLALSCNWFEHMFETVSSLLQDTAVGCSNCFNIELPREIVPSAKRKKSNAPGKGKSVNGKGELAIKENYQNAVGLAWQIKDLLASEISRKAMFKSKYSKAVVLALRVTSEVSISHSLCYDFMDASLVDAYMALSLCLTLHNVTINNVKDHINEENTEPDSGSFVKQTLVDETLDRLLSCTETILSVGGLAKFGSISTECKQCSAKTAQIHRKKQVKSHVDATSSDDEGSPISYRRRVLNLVKMCSAFLKFIVDVATMDLLSYNQQRCLSFTSTYLQNIMSMLKRCFHDESKFQDDQMREVYACLKSSFTYAAKLLNIVLAGVSEGSPAPLEVSEVANHLLDLVASVELHCGSNHAARLVTLAKMWLPDVVLGMGSRCMLKQSLEQNVALHLSSDGEMRIHPWHSILANLELIDLKRSASDEDDEDKAVENEKFPAFNMLIGMMVQLLRLNHEILDSVGLVFLIGCATGLQRTEFGLALGLAHFVFKKLVMHDTMQLGKLPMILAYLQELYPQIESRIEEAEDGEGLDELVSVKALIEPGWLFSRETRDTW